MKCKCGHSELNHTNSNDDIVGCGDSFCKCEKYESQDPSSSGGKIGTKRNQHLDTNSQQTKPLHSDNSRSIDSVHDAKAKDKTAGNFINTRETKKEYEARKHQERLKENPNYNKEKYQKKKDTHSPGSTTSMLGDGASKYTHTTHFAGCACFIHVRKIKDVLDKYYQMVTVSFDKPKEGVPLETWMYACRFNQHILRELKKELGG